MTEKYHRMPMIHPDTDRKYIVLFRMVPPSGDGWNEPRDPGGPEFSGVFGDDKSVSSEIWEWAENEFATRRVEACEIAGDWDGRMRDYAAETRGELG